MAKKSDTDILEAARKRGVASLNNNDATRFNALAREGSRRGHAAKLLAQGNQKVKFPWE